MKTKVRTLRPVTFRTVEAREFRRIVEDRRNDIESVRFVPPKIGADDFGRFRVEFKEAELVDV